MEQLTLTMAGQQAIAGGARLCAGSRLRPASVPAVGHVASAIPAAYGHLHSAKWTVDAAAEPTTTAFMVFDGKNRPTRQPSELSP
jgi:hypothetical protein